MNSNERDEITDFTENSVISVIMTLALFVMLLWGLSAIVAMGIISPTEIELFLRGVIEFCLGLL